MVFKENGSERLVLTIYF